MAGHSNNNKYVFTDQEAKYFSFVYNRNAQKTLYRDTNITNSSGEYSDYQPSLKKCNVIKGQAFLL